jgi:hypothetical protein
VIAAVAVRPASQISPASCSGRRLAINVTAAANDSGPITQAYAAGASLTVSVQTAAAGCTTRPADANVVVQYRMR